MKTEIFEIFWKFWNLMKILKSYENFEIFEIFWNIEFFWKFLNFWILFEILNLIFLIFFILAFWNFLNIFEIFEVLKFIVQWKNRSKVSSILERAARLRLRLGNLLHSTCYPNYTLHSQQSYFGTSAGKLVPWYYHQWKHKMVNIYQ